MIGGGERHPLQILATLSGHYSRDAATRRAATPRTRRRPPRCSDLKGSTFPARKALDQARRARAAAGWRGRIELLAGADLDMRGRVEWPDELLLEVLSRRLVAPWRRGRGPEAGG